MTVKLRWTDGQVPPRRARCPGCFSEKELVPTCRHCGYDEGRSDEPHVLPTLTMIGEGRYKIGMALGRSAGFSVTYLALEIDKNRRKVIKEYFPRRLAERSSTGQELVVRPEAESNFRYGLERFCRESRLLSKIDHPNLAAVRHSLEENRTAYRVLDYYGGVGLERFLEERGGRMSEREALKVIRPLVEGLGEVHSKRLVHSDVCLGNIRMVKETAEDSEGVSESERRPVLVDFAAARHDLAERLQELRAVLSSGYAAPEVYHSLDRRTSATDIYGAAAVLYRLVTGQKPPDAKTRAGSSGDPLRPPAKMATGISTELEEAVLQGLSIDPGGRPAAEEFLRLLSPSQTSPSAAPIVSPPELPQQLPKLSRDDLSPPPSLYQPKKSRVAWPLWGFIVAALAAILAIAFWPDNQGSRMNANAKAPGQEAARQRRPELSQALIERVRGADADGVRRLLEQGADPDTKSADGAPVLVLAARRAQIETAKALLEAGANVDATDKAGVTALKAAVFFDSPEIVALILPRNPSDRAEALRLAHEINREEIVQILEKEQ